MGIKSFFQQVISLKDIAASHNFKAHGDDFFPNQVLALGDARAFFSHDDTGKLTPGVGVQRDHGDGAEISIKHHRLDWVGKHKIDLFAFDIRQQRCHSQGNNFDRFAEFLAQMLGQVTPAFFDIICAPMRIDADFNGDVPERQATRQRHDQAKRNVEKLFPHDVLLLRLRNLLIEV